MGKEVAVKGCSLTISSGGSGPAPEVTNQPSSDVLVNSKGVFFKEIKFSVKNVTAGDIGYADGQGTGSISGTASSILNGSGEKAVLKDDESALVTVNGTKPGPNGSRLPASGQIKVKVSSAGQTDVIAL